MESLAICFTHILATYFAAAAGTKKKNHKNKNLIGSDM